MPKYTFILNGERVGVECAADERLLWVLRDRLDVKGPKYGCGIGVCQACTCHINGKAVNVCSVAMSQMRSSDKVTTIEGLGRSVGKELHPVQSAWLEHDVSQCGFCQPGQIMAASALVKEVHAKGRRVNDNDLDNLRNVCRCGTYPRIRAAIKDVSQSTPVARKKKRKPAKKKAKKASASE